MYVCVPPPLKRMFNMYGRQNTVLKLREVARTHLEVHFFASVYQEFEASGTYITSFFIDPRHNAVRSHGRTLGRLSISCDRSGENACERVHSTLTLCSIKWITSEQKCWILMIVGVEMKIRALDQISFYWTVIHNVCWDYLPNIWMKIDILRIYSNAAVIITVDIKQNITVKWTVYNTTSQNKVADVATLSHNAHIPYPAIHHSELTSAYLHISVLNCVYWGMGQVHCGICEFDLLAHMILTMLTDSLWPSDAMWCHIWFR